MKTDPNCEYCKGKGWYWVQNGPDYCEKEPCDCLDFDYESAGVEDGGMPNNEVRSE